MFNKFTGAILLVAGTTIGAGILAMPLVIAETGFIPGIAIFTVCWVLMLSSAYLMLETNLAITEENNDMVTMAGQTLGNAGKLTAWVAYLLLLYTLTAAYIRAGTPWVSHWLHPWFNTEGTTLGTATIFTVFLALFVFSGTKRIDISNRILISALFIAFLAVIFSGILHIHVEQLTQVNFKPLVWTYPAVVTTFGFHVVIPTISTYLKHDKTKLKGAIFIGACIPFCIYILWLIFIFGVMPQTGKHGLITLKQNHASPADLAYSLGVFTSIDWLPNALNIFSFCAVLTSFLGVSASLFHFLKDGLHKLKLGSPLFIAAITFLPPLFVAVYYPEGFAAIISIAGIFVAILLGILPIFMSYSGRYKLNIIKEPIVPFGKIGLAILLIGFLAVVPVELINVFN